MNKQTKTTKRVAEYAEEQKLQFDLFDESGTYENDVSGATVLFPIHEFPPIHYKRVQENG